MNDYIVKIGKKQYAVIADTYKLEEDFFNFYEVCFWVRGIVASFPSYMVRSIHKDRTETF